MSNRPLRLTFLLVLALLAAATGCQAGVDAPAHDSGIALDSGTPGDGGADAGQDAGLDAGADPKLTILRVHYPAGTHTVSMRGGGGPWNWTQGVALTASSEDTWTLSTTALTAEVEWKPLLDDSTWSRGPNYRVKPGQTLDVFPRFTTVKGSYELRWPSFHSSLLNNNRPIWVYYPPTYLENPRARFPVVYMHDGQNVFDPSTAFGGNEWKADEAFDAAAENGEFPEAIVVGVGSNSARIWEYTPSQDSGEGGGADLYLKMLVTELKPQVDADLRTRPDRESTVLIGSSLGGLVSAYAGAKYPTTFGLVGEMSPSTWWDGKMILGVVTTTAATLPRPVRVYVDSGDSGASKDDMANTKLLAQAYTNAGYQAGVDLLYVVQPGANHSETYWAQRFPGAMHFLLGPRTP